MKSIHKTRLKTQLRRVLDEVAQGASFTILDRHTAIARLVPIRAARRLRIRPPKAGALPLNRVPLPGPAGVDLDAVRWLLEERQVHR